MKNGVRGPYLYLFQVPKGEVHENVAKGIFKDIMAELSNFTKLMRN